MANNCPRDVLTGSCGAVYCATTNALNNAIGRVTNWTVEATAESKTWADSSLCTSSYTNFVQRLPGNKSATGTVDFIYIAQEIAGEAQPQDTVVIEGACCYLILQLDQNTGLAWVIPVAIVTRLSLTVNIKDAEPIGGSFSFESSGLYYTPFDLANPFHI